MIAEYRPAMLESDHAVLPIGSGAFNGIALVDLEDSWLEKYTWVKHNAGYAKACIKGKEVFLHHVLMPTKGKETVDHINGDRLDNRRSNLRVCSQGQNNLNKPAQPHSKQPYKGIEYMPKLNKYRARVRLNNKRYSLGCFDSPIDAALAYNAKAKELFGEYAYLNEVAKNGH